MSSSELSSMPMDETRLVDFISQIVAGDPLSLDLPVSFMAAALQSYRHDTVLRPFPQFFITDNETKEYQRLADTLTTLKAIQRMDWEALSQTEKDLLTWIYNMKYSVESCPRNEFERIQKMTGHSVPMPMPHYIFKVTYEEEKNTKFLETKGSRKSIFAYHGSKLENFHSILNFGLNAHMSKNALFGEGTYLTSELSVAMSFCPTGQGWKNSQLGEKLGCVAVCEIIDDPSVKCQEKHEDLNNQTRSRIRGSEGGQIPEKYYVVQNNDLVRVNYLLIYSQRHKPSKTYSWFQQNKFILLMLSYLVLLLGVALYANKDLSRKLKRLF